MRYSTQLMILGVILCLGSLLVYAFTGVHWVWILIPQIFALVSLIGGIVEGGNESAHQKNRYSQE